MQLVAVVERGEGEDKKSFWTRIGVAFENKDGTAPEPFTTFVNSSPVPVTADFNGDGITDWFTATRAVRGCSGASNHLARSSRVGVWSLANFSGGSEAGVPG